MYQFICFTHYVLFQTSVARRGDAADAKSNAEWLGILHFLLLSAWLLYELEPLTGIKTILEHVWDSWFDGRSDPRLGPMFLLVVPLTFTSFYFFLARQHGAIMRRYAHVMLPRLLPFTFVSAPVGIVAGLLAKAADPWPLPAALGMAALWLLEGFGFRAWLKRNTLPAV